MQRECIGTGITIAITRRCIDRIDLAKRHP
jgi:hypothetical protein